MYLFQDKKLQPSTIDGYRSVIADKLGNSPVNISKDENLTRLLDSFHRDRPKGRRGIPSWNLSLVLHQLTKAPFEQIKEVPLKHLTFKMVFLLALGSGKHRSEIHAWQNKNIRHQSDWSKVSLYPSASFLSKNQLVKCCVLACEACFFSVLREKDHFMRKLVIICVKIYSMMFVNIQRL